MITTKSFGKNIIKLFLSFALIGLFIGFAIFTILKKADHPLAHKKITNSLTGDALAIISETSYTEQTFTFDDLLSNIDTFVDTPEGATPWHLFGLTKQHDYSYEDEEGFQWSGVRPEFSEELKLLDSKEITIKGYMFPLEQEEKQSVFLLGPFPISCPYHYHVTPNLIIEVHADKPLAFTYDAVTIKGELELVPKDDEYNLFYRIKNSVMVK